MRKFAPFVLTVAASVLLTATIVQAAASGDPEAATASTSRVTVALSLSSCGSPNNAAEWSRFARCANANFAKIERWAACLKKARVSQRPDDAYMDALGSATVQAPGLVPGGGGANPRTLLEWKPTCL
jgi:hypothetical protein